MAETKNLVTTNGTRIHPTTVADAVNVGSDNLSTVLSDHNTRLTTVESKITLPVYETLPEYTADLLGRLFIYNGQLVVYLAEGVCKALSLTDVVMKEESPAPAEGEQTTESGGENNSENGNPTV